MSAKMNVPELRFKEFSGEWNNIKLADIGKVSMCKRIMKDQTILEGEIPFYKIGTFGKQPDAYISKELYESYKKKFSFPKKGDILISASGTIGRTVVYDGLPAYFQDSNIVWIDNHEKLVKNTFLSFSYETITWNTENTTIARLYNDNLRNIQINIPSLPEQEKIASFLSSVDTKIEQLTKKKTLLEQYKKGVMQKIFSQEIRFRDDDGGEYPEWVERKLGDAFKIGSGKDYKHLSSGDIPVYGTGGYMLSVSDYLYEGESVCIGRKGTIDKPMFLDGKFWTVDTLFYTHSFKDSIPKFIFYIFQTINWKLYNEASGVPSLSKSTIEKIDFLFPSINEQTKIANFLTSIDTKISQTGQQLEATKQFKKALLQQMFV